MGRRRNKVPHAEAGRLAANLSAAHLDRRIEENLTYQRNKAAQAEYLERIAKVEKDILSRSVFVTQVRDLKQAYNLAQLKLFFESRYGPVEECVTTNYSGKGKKQSKFGTHAEYPPARVRFVLKRDAEKIFGKELLLARTGPFVPIQGCPVGCGGQKGSREIKVFASDPYPNMTKEALAHTRLSFNGKELALGHWFSANEEDSYNIVGDGEGRLHEGVSDNLWLEEVCSSRLFSVLIDLQERTVEIELHLHKRERDVSSSVIQFRFKDLHGPIRLFLAEGAMFFRLKYPPKLYKYTGEKSQRKLIRQVELCGIHTSYFGRCLGYRLSLDEVAISRLQVNKKAVEKVRHFGIWKEVPDLNPFSTLQVSIAQKVELDIKLEQCITAFKEGILLLALLDHGKFCWYHALNDRVQVGPDCYRDIFELIQSTPSNISCRVLQKMRDFHGQTRFPASVFRNQALLEAEQEKANTILPTYCVELPRVLLTPTRLSVIGLQVEMSNRVVRKFVKEEGRRADCFLRLSVGDENGDKLYFEQLTPPVESRISDLLLSGISVNGKRYSFLAYSSSQLKELSVWMVATSAGFSVDDIRRWMGDFSECKTASKFAARMGQCFSTTVQTLASRVEQTIGETQISVSDNLQDVVKYVARKEMCHSDGTGLIKKEFMSELLKRVPFAPIDLSTVSIIQIRFGGAKGTLTAWDFSELKSARNKTSARRGDIDENYEVLLRPSMIKFDAPYRRLEVVSVGTHVPYYLNRYVILLLGVHGVPDRLFLEMQSRTLAALDNMLFDSAAAANIVPGLNGNDSMMSTIHQMISAGLSPVDEPFLFSVLHAIRTHQLTDLRKKARIFVRDGAVLIGGLDETGLVPEGCIFVQVLQNTNGVDEFKPLVGPVMVTKHPVMHPGDVRMLLAVDVVELRGHKNVILFSQCGTRPEANKMSGSDLDGDQFAVTWDSRLFLKEWNCCSRSDEGVWTSQRGVEINLRDWKLDAFRLQQANAIPMDYSGTSTTATCNYIGDNEIIQHFVDHAKSANLGWIATLWLDHAAKKGASCKYCLELAELHSIAVDFPKSGICAVIPDHLFIRKQEPRAHWREKKGVDSYKCESILGKLYDEVVACGERSAGADQIAMAGRRIDKHGQILCSVDKGQRYFLATRLQQTFQSHIASKLGWSLDGIDQTDNDDLLLFANRQRRDYENSLRTLMNKYHLQCEGELLTGCIRKFHPLNKRRSFTLLEEVKLQCKELQLYYRQIFFEEVMSMSNPEAHATMRDRNDRSLEDALMVVEKMATDQRLPEGGEDLGFLHQSVRKHARKLAAAMYMVTYDPQIRLQDGLDTILFSFPWIVADVIAVGVNSSEAQIREF